MTDAPELWTVCFAVVQKGTRQIAQSVRPAWPLLQPGLQSEMIPVLLSMEIRVSL